MAITPTLKVQATGQRQLQNVQAVTAAGSAKSDATLIGTKARALVVASGADGTKGIRLPKAVPGKAYTVKNVDNAVLKVYPYEDESQINVLSAGAAISMAARTCATFHCSSTAQWYTEPLLPS